MQIEVDIQYKLTLDTSEYRVLGLALAGKLKREEDKRAAGELNKRLLALRAKNLKQMADMAEATQAKAEICVEARPSFM